MTSFTSRIAVGAGIALMAAGANAATLDFSIPTSGFSVQSYTDISGYDASSAITGGNITGETGFDSIILDVAGENLDVWINDNYGDGNPYFDADSGGPGGLGNCRNFTGGTTAQCDPNSDDNLTIATTEELTLGFTNDGGAVITAYFGEFLFYDDNHQAINGNIRVTHDGGSSTIAVAGGVGDLSGIGGSTFLIFNDQGDSIKADQNYYITAATVTAVPVPAAVWLFGSGLGLLGWLRRKPAA
jgi:hypothetical protein